jgi:UDP-N-acetylmuramyl pentapeptide phosphotransferase/UDP-N-acetylglucosamine-1-phosphate transferase
MQGIDGLSVVGLTGLLSGLLTGLAIWACLRFGIQADRSNCVQTTHRQWAPRVGGLPIVVTTCAGAALWFTPDRTLILFLLGCGLPAFLAGFVEDLFECVGPKARLWATFISAWLAWFFVDGQLTAVGVPGLDWLLGHVTVVAFVFTAFAVGGVAHSINIIDGFNGLSACFCMICFAAYFVVATLVGDHFVQCVSLLFCGTLLGFLAWNFPFGRVFLGDGGAYFLGFVLGEMSVLLVARNPEISPWFCFLVMAYPIWDTLFSYYRREFVRGVAWSSPDALHLHHLIYRRLVKPYAADPSSERVLPNSITSVYLWGLSLLTAVPAVFFWDRPLILAGLSLLFVVSYSLFYRRLAKFRAPRVLRMPTRRTVRAGEVEQQIPVQTAD